MTTINRPHPHRPMHLPRAVLFAAFGLIAAAGLVTAFLMNNASSPSTVLPNVSSLPVPSSYRVTSEPVIAYILVVNDSADPAWRGIAESYSVDLTTNPPRQSEVYVVGAAAGADGDALIQALYADANVVGHLIQIVDLRAIVPSNVASSTVSSSYRVTSQPIVAYIVTSQESANNARQQIADVTNMQFSLGLVPSQSEVFVMTEGQDIDALIRDLYADANAFGRQIVVLDRRGE